MKTYKIIFIGFHLAVGVIFTIAMNIFAKYGIMTEAFATTATAIADAVIAFLISVS